MVNWRNTTMSSTETVRAEIDENISDLQLTKGNLIEMHDALSEDSLMRSEINVINMAIDGLLSRLAVPNLAEDITLPVLVQLTDDIKAAKTTATRLLSRRHVGAH
jgi:hypothetical protein